MCEVFKPVIVFRTIFELVNNRKIQVEKHFVKEANYCLLNEEGRNIFITAFEGRLESVFDLCAEWLSQIILITSPSGYISSSFFRRQMKSELL